MVGFGGIGVGPFGPGSCEVLNVQHPGGNITGAGFQSVASFTLEGGLLSTNNLLYVLAFLIRTVGTGTMLPRLTYGSTSVQAASAGQPNAGVDAFLFGDDSVSAQHIFIGPRNTVSQYDNGSLAEDSTADLTVALAIDLSTDTDVFVCHYFGAFLYRAP